MGTSQFLNCRSASRLSHLFLSALVLSFPSLGHGFFLGSSGSDQDPCPIAREWITVYRYLQEQPEGSVETRARTLADSASEGCKGAAARFIQTEQLLSKIGLPSEARLELAVKRARGVEAEMEAFRSILTTSFARDLLDLDASATLALTEKLMRSASTLSQKMASPLPWQGLSETFPRLVRLCSGETATQSEPLAPVVCGKMVEAYLIQVLERKEWESHFSAQTGNRVSAADRLISLVEFLTDDIEDEKRLPFQAAFELALRILETGEFAGENWKDAFRFASRPAQGGGLGMSWDEANRFALSVIAKAKASQ